MKEYKQLCLMRKSLDTTIQNDWVKMLNRMCVHRDILIQFEDIQYNLNTKEIIATKTKLAQLH